MESKFYFDCAAIAIMIILQMNDIRQGKEWNGRNTSFRFILFVSIICAMSSIADDVLIACGKEYTVANILVKSISAMCYIVIAPLYVTYLIFAADMSHRLRQYKILIVAIMAPAIGSFLHVMAVFVKMTAFSMTEIKDLMEFEAITVIIISVILFYSLIGMGYLFYIKHLIEKTRFIVLLSPMAVLCLSLLLWYTLPQITSISFVIGMCFLIIVLFNRRTNGRIDNVTNFRTQAAFVDTIKSAKKVKKKLNIIVVDITNYDVILQRVGFENITNSVGNVSAVIKKALSNNGVRSYEAYYNGNGRYFVLIYERYFSKSNSVCTDILKRMALENGIGEVDCSLYVNTCNIGFPEDAEDIDTITMLSEDLRKTPHSLHVLSIDELNSSKDFELRRQMNRIIDNGLANNHFSVNYQPIYNVKKDKFVSAEALVRLNDPVHGFISPGIFIPIAEKSGAIHKLGRFIIEEVCRFMASEDFKNLGVEYIEVNLSVEQCHRVNLIEEIESITQKYGILPSQLNLEITETAACYSENRLVNNLRALHNLGYSFSLDDFGTGYSNLLRMATLPLNLVKLDRTFVLMDEEDEKFHVVIKNMVKLFRQMGLKILVEGVETAEMVEKFVDIDVDYIQGYYYSKPLKKDEYVEFINHFNLRGSTGKIL